VYIPEFNRQENRAAILGFMRANPFAILVSNAEGIPFATHLPLLVEDAGDQFVVQGHMAKANAHWKSMKTGEESLVIFHGAHAYISPALYEIRESVPTWNYAAVHVYGESTVFSDEACLKETLDRMINAFDSSYMSQWSNLSDEYRSRMMKHIVGFEIKVKRLEAKFKLSQNRTKGEQSRVIQSLSQSKDSNISAVAELMQKEGLGRKTSMAEKKDPPLAGLRIVVGRARHQASALSAGLRKLGAEVLEIPFIEIRKPRSYQPLDSALKNLQEYEWLILTSVNGVEAVWERLKKLGLTNKHLKHLKVAAIGPATSKAIEKRGIKVNVVPEKYVAESVVESLRNQVAGKRVLLARARVARDVIPRELRRLRAKVDVVEAYETIIPQSSRMRLRAILKDSKGRPQVITFTSSSTVRNFVALLGKNPQLDGIRLASIGPITSSTLREFGLPVDVEATEYTIPGLIKALARSEPGRFTL
jgi:uroporphyrinogen-III synthase/predicted FMN-binding regulatory protein PaiB